MKFGGKISKGGETKRENWKGRARNREDKG
jgi:hypothetical protein